MRYYIYIDKDLIKNLIATYGNFNFNIDVVEYSVQKNCGNINNIRVEPRKENMCDGDKGHVKRNSTGFGVDSGMTYNVITEEKYINISDISEIKNIEFYHNLIENLRKLKNGATRENSKVVEEEGKIEKIFENRSYEDNIFNINNSYVWYDKEKSLIDMNLFSNVCGEVKVLGYNINEDAKRSNKMLKAIAIYVE